MTASLKREQASLAACNTYFRHQSLNYRPEWVDEKFSGRLSLDVKAGEDGED